MRQGRLECKHGGEVGAEIMVACVEEQRRLHGVGDVWHAWCCEWCGVLCTVFWVVGTGPYQCVAVHCASFREKQSGNQCGLGMHGAAFMVPRPCERTYETDDNR